MQGLGRHHVVQQPQAQRGGGVKTFGGQEIAVGRPFAHGPDHIGADGGGQQPQAGFRQAEVRGIRGDGDVAGRQQAHAAGVGIAVHAGNDGFGARPDGVQHIGQPGGVGAIVGVGMRGHLAHPVQVAARAERLAGAGQEQHAHTGILRHLPDGAGQRGDQGLVESVAHVGAVQLMPGLPLY
ncbi:hypothetical protein G6F35_014526 [Rhizopus arrhizus]|nr:hypothetical protein G6F35_014526 [Rhizopus arrhizus]